jgi:hypothetical protein
MQLRLQLDFFKIMKCPVIDPLTTYAPQTNVFKLERAPSFHPGADIHMHFPTMWLNKSALIMGGIEIEDV